MKHVPTVAKEMEGAKQFMDYQQKIRGYEREIHINKGIVKQEFWHLGTIAFEHPETIEPLHADAAKSITDILASIEQDRRSKADIQGDIQQIEELQQNIADFSASIQNRMNELSALDLEYHNTLEAFGRTVFAQYANSPQTYLPYSAQLKTLDELHRESFNAEKKVNQLQESTEKDPLFKKMVSQTKLQFYRNQLKSVTKKISQSFEICGEEMLSSWQSASESIPALETAVEPVLSQKETREETQKTIGRLKDERELAVQKLRQLAGKGKTDEYVAELQLRISEIEESERNHLTDIGKTVYEQLGNDTPDAMKDSFGNIQKLETENEQKEAIIRRLKAAIRVEALDEERARFSLKEDKLNRQIADVQQQLERVQRTIEGLSKEISEQENIRGDEAELR